MKTRRRRLECETLETRALLSTTHGHFGGHLHTQGEAVSPGKGGVTLKAEVATSTPVTGGGLVNVPTNPVNSDVTAMQSGSAAIETVLFLTQFEALSGSNSSTEQLALSILNDTRNVELSFNNFAGSQAIMVPPNIGGPIQSLATQMISGVTAGTTDQTFSSLIVQAESSLVAQFQAMATGAQDANIRSFAASILPTIQTDLAAAQGKVTLPPVSSTPSSGMLNASDLSNVETYYSINLMERFLGQLTVLVTQKPMISMYSSKLIADHEGGELQLGGYAASTQTYLPAAISSGDAPMALTIINALGSVRPGNSTHYDRVYLNQMIMGHTAALQFTNSVITTTQNPELSQFATNIGSTIWMHLVTAKTLYRRLPH
jgi:uncharacterized protein (DUF305 family)